MDKPTVDWLDVIETQGKIGWLNFYKKMLGHPVSQTERFFQAIDRLGKAAVFEAIISTSTRNLKDDPINYVLAVAGKIVMQEVQEITESKKYTHNLNRAKERMRLQNELLEMKIERAKEIAREKPTTE